MSDDDRSARVARALYVADGQGPETGITVGTDVVDESDDGRRRVWSSRPPKTGYLDTSAHPGRRSGRSSP